MIRINTQFSYNGKTYKSLEEMPPEVREVFEKLKSSGLPAGIFSKKVTMQRFEINGKEYNSVEEMPPEVRDWYEKALAKKTEGLVEQAMKEIPAEFAEHPSSSPAGATSLPGPLVVEARGFGKFSDGFWRGVGFGLILAALGALGLWWLAKNGGLANLLH
ncbi:MAG: hypothetical protein JO317_05600 [Verrucomicrobiae bacterium]|nr:hypothetical protein [Verrucomicrobiae bacterium]